jgi:hypothetical protein
MIGLGNIPVEEFRSGRYLRVLLTSRQVVVIPWFFHRPLLFVSNHPILGFEFPLLLSELYKQTGIFLRALTDHSHWQVRFFRFSVVPPAAQALASLCAHSSTRYL